MSFCAYVLTVDGCPYSFATAGCPAMLSLPPGFAAPVFDWADEWVPQVGMLAWPEGSISERLALSDGQLSVGGLDFEIHADLPLVGGPYAGELGLRLFTTRASRIAQSLLAASFESGDATMTLASTAGFPSGTQTVWCEQEALRVSRSGSTLTVAALGWGYHGSRSEDHALDTARGYAPIVWAEFPGVERRRCTLWEVTEEGYATAVWRGRITRPHLAEDGGVFVLSCDSVWDAVKDTRVVRDGGTVTLSGWFLHGVGSLWGYSFLYASVRTATTQVISVPVADEAERTCATLDELVAVVQRRLQDALTAAGLSGLFVTLTYDETKGITLTARGPSGDFSDVNLSMLGLPSFNATSTDNTVDTGVRTSTVTIDAEKIHAAYLPARAPALVPATVILDTSLGFPASFTEETVTSSPGLVVYRPALVGELDDEQFGENYLLSFAPSSVDAATSSAVGTFDFVPKSRGVRPFPRGQIVLTRPQTLTLVARINAEHWAYAIDYAFTTWSTARRAAIDARDWSRSLEPRVVGATEGTPELARARWYLDGERTFGELVSSQCRLNGCAVGVGPNGRLRLVPLRPPTPTDELAATFTSADYLEGHTPRFELLDESVRTSAQFKADRTTVRVSDLDAEARYGATAPVEIEAVGQIEGLSQEIVSPDLLAAQLLRYVLGSWSGPCSAHTLTVSLDTYGQSVFLGDAVAFDSFNAPDGAGGRGLTAQRGIVIGREGSLEGEDALVLTVLVFEEAERIAAVAPCLRVASISGAVITVAIDYLTGSATDYAGSNTGGYRFTAAGEDGGTSWASLCTRWKLVTRGATTQLVQTGLVLSAYDPATRTLTFTASIPTGVQNWATFVSGGGLADLVPEDYADVTDTERDWAYVGSESANVIDGTTDAPNRWAP